MVNLSSTDLNHKVHKMIEISSQENMLLKSIEKFYEELVNINDFISIIDSESKNSNSKISIRLIDYFVTKYSKKNKISYKLNENQLNFNIYQSYKQQLKAYQKKHFDPFARGIRIPYFIKSTSIITTIGQLNFFKWFISKEILDYVIKNKLIIEEDMNMNKKNSVVVKFKKIPNIYKKIEYHKNIPLINNYIDKNRNNIMVTF